MSRPIDADKLGAVKFHPLPYTHITPSDVEAESYKRGWNDAIDSIIENAPTIEPEPQWIPCSERLPEEDGEYLVLYHTRSAYKPYVYDVISFANDLYKIDEYDFYDEKGQKGWFYYDREYGYCEDDSVIAWMPLPEPYREEGDE